MNLLRRGRSDQDTSAETSTKAAPETAADAAGDESTRNTTAAKGRPTPSRREAEAKRRGPVAPAPLTSKEARARRRAQRGNKQDRKQATAERRAASAARREGMMRGEEQYLLPRDKGPVRGYVRDIVDARRNIVGLFMPMALILLVVMFLGPALQFIVTLVMLVMMVFMLGEGFILGRIVNKRVRERYPDSTAKPLSLGWYAFVRASQIRRLRAPKPRVGAGDAV